MGAKGRKPWLLKFQEWILDNAEHITDVVQSESGKPRAEASIGAPVSADCLNYWARNAAEVPGRQAPHAAYPADAGQAVDDGSPAVSACRHIAPWNFPFMMSGIDVPPALAAGAALLLKPSEVTPLSGAEFVRGWTEIGAPPVLGLATGTADTGAAVSPTRTMCSSPVRRPPDARSRWPVRRAADPLQPGTRRKGPCGRARRRRSRTRRRTASHGRAAQLGPGLRPDRAGLRRGARLRRIRRQAHRQGGRLATGSGRPSLPVRCGRDGHRGATRPGRAPRRRGGRRGRNGSPPVASRPGRNLLSSQRCLSMSTTR